MIANTVEEMRLASGMTVAEVAAHVGADIATIEGYETGAEVDADHAARLGDLWAVTPEFVVRGNELGRLRVLALRIQTGAEQLRNLCARDQAGVRDVLVRDAAAAEREAKALGALIASFDGMAS